MNIYQVHLETDNFCDLSNFRCWTTKYDWNSEINYKPQDNTEDSFGFFSDCGKQGQIWTAPNAGSSH